MGLSLSTSESIQNAQSYITQQSQQSCDVTCQNVMKDVNIDIINSRVSGGVKITQSCSTNANCMFGNAMDAVGDVQLKAANSTNASNAWSGWSLNPFSVDVSESMSQQNIKNSITQTSSQECNISSFNQMNDVTILAVNSNITGGIEISQDASTQGSCTLNNTMNAAAYSMGMATNKADSGKFAKGKSSIVYIVMIIAVIIGLGIIAKVISGQSKTTATKKQLQQIASARARQCVSEGGKLQVYTSGPRKGKPVIGTDGKPMCALPTKAQKIELEFDTSFGQSKMDRTVKSSPEWVPL